MEAKINIPDWVILDAFRYAIGRRSYQVGVTTDWLIANLDSFSDELAMMIDNEINEELERDSRARLGGDGLLPLGMDCDRADWLRVYVETGNRRIKIESE